MTIDPWSVEHTGKCRIHDHLFEKNAVAADCSCGAVLHALVPAPSSDATQDIRDFFKAVDAGWLGQMPSGFNQSAFVVALRSRLNHAVAAEPPSGAGVNSNPPSDIEELVGRLNELEREERKAVDHYGTGIETGRHAAELAGIYEQTIASLRSLASERDQLREHVRRLILLAEDAGRKHWAIVSSARSILPQEGK
jgi:hypothetical protein